MNGLNWSRSQPPLKLLYARSFFLSVLSPVFCRGVEKKSDPGAQAPGPEVPKVVTKPETGSSGFYN